VTAIIVPDLSDLAYHKSPALSASGAKLILKSPAHYRWAMDHPAPPSPTFTLGHAVHSLVLGSGRQVVRVYFDDYKTKDARLLRDVLLSADMIPLTRPEWAQVRAMADAVLSHPLAAALFADGQPELSIFTADPETGVELRTRPDWIGSRFVVDLKTAATADPREFANACERYGYFQQAAWYLDQAAAAGLIDDDARFLFVLVEKDAPHLVNVVEPDMPSVQRGREKNRRAIDIFAECVATGTWPGYPTDTATIIGSPQWAIRQHEEEYL
jgi:hypothetical protein